MSEIVLKAALLHQLRARAMAAKPSEAVGLLVGGPSDPSTQWKFEPLINEAWPPMSYRYCEVSVGQWETVMADLELEGLEIKAWWHSHPEQVAKPSAKDREHVDPGLGLMVITTGRTDLRYESSITRAWTILDDEAYTAEEIRVVTSL